MHEKKQIKWTFLFEMREKKQINIANCSHAMYDYFESHDITIELIRNVFI